MTSKQASLGGLTALAAILLCTMSFSSAAAQQSKLRIVQTNSAGDNIHLIDPATNKATLNRKQASGESDSERLLIADTLFSIEEISKDGKSALVTFQITGDPDTAKDRVAPSLAATAAAQQAHPALLIGQVGDASAMRAIDAARTTSVASA